jgi:hypothetical protein
MKVTLSHVPHVANKVAIELNKSGLVHMTSGLEAVSREAERVLIENIKQEIALEEKVNEIVNDNEEQIDFYLADERQLFWMIKKKLAPEYGVILSYEERFSDIAHKILDALYEEDLINYDVTENRIKNIIYDAMTSFISDNSDIEEAVIDKMRSYKRQYIPGTDEYEILYDKLYLEELQKKGMA